MKSMDLFLIAALLFCGVSRGVSSNQVKDFPEIKNIMAANRIKADESQVSFDCGGVLETEAGVISYKYGQQLEDAESCLWILRPGRKVSAYIRLVSAGFKTNSRINIYTSVAATGDIIYRQTLTRASTSVSAQSGLPIYIQLVTLKERNANETGLILSFDGYGSDSTTGVKYSDEVLRIDDEDFGVHTHPGNYPQNELSSFLIPLPRGRNLVYIVIYDIGIPTIVNPICSGDVLNVYTVDSLQLYSKIRFCSGGSTDLATLNSNGQILVTFMSANRNLTGRQGFKISWGFIN